jgi:alkylhydroperoxidase family enzyme
VPNLPYADRAAAAPEVRQALETLPDLNLFRMASHADSAFVPWLRFGGALLMSLALDPLLRELAILQVAKLLGSEYEWVQHAEIAAGLGATKGQVSAIENGTLDALDAGGQAITRFTTAVVERRDATEELGDLLATHSPREVVELLMVIGHYSAIAALAHVTGIETDPPANVVEARR